MPVVHVRPGGTKTATGAGDYASTANDWSLANCYDNLHMVGFNSVSGSPADYIQDGDEIILYSERGKVTTHDLAQARLRNIDTGTVTIRSLSQNADDCVLSGSVAAQTDLSFPATADQNFILEDLTLTKSVTHTPTNLPAIYMQNECNNVTFRRVKFVGYIANFGASTSTLAMIIKSRFNGTRKTRTVTFEDCEFSDWSVTSINGHSLMRFDGATASSEATTVEFAGTNRFQRLTSTCTGTGAGHAITGGIHGDPETVINVTGPVIVEDYTATQARETDEHIGFLRSYGPLNVSGDGYLYGERVRISGGRSRCAFVHCEEAYDIQTYIKTVDCENVWGDSSASGTSGTTFLAKGSAAIGTVNRIVAIRPRSRFGAAAYSSDGAALTVKQLYCENARVLHGVIYDGGGGAANISGFCIHGSRQDASLLVVAGEELDDYPGTDVYCHIHASTATAAKTSKFRNGTVLNSDPGGVSAMRINGQNSTYSLSVTLSSLLLDSGAPVELQLNEAASCTLNATLNDCAIPTAERTTTISTGTLTVNRAITGDSLISGIPTETSPYVIADNSPVIAASKTCGKAMRDAWGRTFYNPPTVGGSEYRPGTRGRASRAA